MDKDALDTFLAIHRLGSFSKAAEALHRTQPAISSRMRLLEQELGAPLFERISGGTVLSQAGRVLLPFAERAVAALEDAEQAVRALTTENAGPVSLAVVGTLAGPKLTRVLQRFAAAHPCVDLRLQTARSAEVSNLVRRGEATLGLRYDRDRSPDLQFDALAAEAQRVVCAPAHRLAGRAVGALAALRDERWIAFPDTPGRREIAAAHVFALFLARGLGEVDWLPVDSLTAQQRLVEAGFGIALMPESNIAGELASGALRAIEVADLDAQMPVYAVTRRGGYLSEAARALRALLLADYAA
jgi:DNA-binding transcriptional LysR family regulator